MTSQECTPASCPERPEPLDGATNDPPNDVEANPPSGDAATPTTLLGVTKLGDARACLSESRGMDLRPLALYMMLDSSGSMLEPAGAAGTKWQAIQRAIRAFMVETRDTDLFLGLQFFPLFKPGSSYNCSSHEDCGPDGGPCFLSTCLLATTITLCRSDADCGSMPDVNPCVSFGLCSNSPDPLAPVGCRPLGSTCAAGMGTCQDFPRTCTNATACDPALYATPAVEMGSLSSTYLALDQALTMQQPEGLTPTAPALQGALDHALGWARAHPERTVATLLATDGLPTKCDSQPTLSTQPPGGGTPPQAESTTIDQVLGIATTGASGSRPIRTFVIGVFQPGDGESVNNVNAIARAGGTQQAAFIDTSGEVEAQFLQALRTVRDAAAACRLALPSTEGLDFTRADLVFDAGNGTATSLPYVEGLLGCATSAQGWFYDTPPALGRPQAVELCPSVCQLVKAAPASGLQLQIGCASE